MQYYFDKLSLKLMIRPNEQKLVSWSFIYFFCLLSGYFILRPLRDEMGIINGVNKMQWLFTGTFIAMLLVVPLFGFVTRKYPLKKVLSVSYLFFVSNLVLFYFFFAFSGKSSILASSFFIWLSVFNLFVVSLFWSFMADVFSSNASKRVFGIIAAGGSLGALVGPIIASFIVKNSSIKNLILIAICFLLGAIFSIKKITKLKVAKSNKRKGSQFSPTIVLKKNFWKELQKVFQSKYLLTIIGFILLYTAISTFLYFEQAHILENTIKQSDKRIVYFSNVDLITNVLAIGGQFLVTNRIIKRYGLAFALGSIPFLLAIGFVIVSYKLSLLVIAILIIIHRAGNFSILKPSREMLYTVCNKEEKYRAKNFIDTVVYRGGDALTGWIFTLFISLGFGLSIIALLAVPLVLLWSLTGYRLGKKQEIKEKQLILNTNNHVK